METEPVSETLCFLFVEIRMMDKVQKLNSNERISSLADIFNPESLGDIFFRNVGFYNTHTAPLPRRLHSLQ
jgi:hypothetical protein